MKLRRLIIASTLALVAACSSGGDETDVATVDFGAALSATAEITHYRLTQSTGQTTDVAALGLSGSTEPDPDQPTVIGQVTPERSYVEIDFDAVFASFPGSEAGKMRIWSDPERVVIDTTDLGAAFAGVDAGPMEPGIGYVDLTRVESEASDLVAAITGGGMPDLTELATSLPAALSGVTETETGVFTGAISHADFLTTMGQDVETLSRTTAAGLALTLDVDVNALTRVYVDAFTNSAAEMTVVVEGGVVREIREVFDVTVVFDAMLRDDSLFDSAAEQSEFETTFADAVWIIETVMTFEPDPALVVEPLPATDDDRTDAWVEFLRGAGF
ncbi:MAG TPA: hypothetical protein VMN58_07300 [Acidimicrobiales bacterium]|nr:hypothetical protein [Acidimicrobiales bacterium]